MELGGKRRNNRTNTGCQINIFPFALQNKYPNPPPDKETTCRREACGPENSRLKLPTSAEHQCSPLIVSSVLGHSIQFSIYYY